MNRPHVNWDGILRHWLNGRRAGQYPPAPNHWMTADGRPRCACCGLALPRSERRQPPRCADHSDLVTAVEQE